MRLTSRIVAIFIILVACILGWFILPDKIQAFVSNPGVLFFIAAFSVIPLVLLLENWRKLINPVITVVYNILTYRHRIKYYPPKISIEGHGIQRGLTVVEAAVLTQKPSDQILAILLDNCLKKHAIHISVDPLQLK